MPSPSDFESALTRALEERRCLKLTFSRPVDSARATRETVRPVEVGGEGAYQFAFREGTQERHENHDPEAAAVRAAALFARDYFNANLFTNEADFAVQRRDDGRLKVKRSAPTLAAAPPRESHDRIKRYTIPEGVPCPFLVEIGVMTAAGKVRADKQHKFRQINRFLEFVEDVLQELPSSGPLHVVDFGCGKSSLTFAVHHLLTSIHGREVRMLGLDRNGAVVESCREVARRLECRGLEFAVGDIARHETNDPVHLAISLHACDTASDFALAKAVSWGADVVLAVPCCQHELAPQLQNDDLAPLLRHGILRERFASLATDALRANCLELAGYRTQVLEFVDLDHTPKNLLLRGVRRNKRGKSEMTHTEPTTSTGGVETARRHEELARMMHAFQVKQFTLSRLLGLAGEEVSTPVACDPDDSSC